MDTNINRIKVNLTVRTALHATQQQRYGRSITCHMDYGMIVCYLAGECTPHLNPRQVGW